MELFKLFGTIAINNSEANQAIDDTTGKAETSSNRMIEIFKKVGKAVVTYFAVDKIIDFGKEIVRTSATVNAEMSAFEQIMGDYSDNAQTKMNEVADATGAVSTRLTPYMTSLTAKFKGLGYDIDEATTLASDGLMLASDASAFWDKSLDDSMSALNSFINGSYEGGEAIGLFANDTQMASYAVKEGIVKQTKAWANLDEATKQATRLEYAKAMFEASGAVGQASKESEQYANVQANLTEKWRQFKAQIGEPLLENVVLPAMKKLSDAVDILSQEFENIPTYIEQFKNKIQEAKQWCEEHSTVLQILGVFIGGLTTAILAYNAVAIAKAIADGAMTLAIGAYCTVTSIATTVTTAFSAVMAFLTSPITLVILAITALIAIGVLLYKNWDVVKEKCSEIAGILSEKWEGIKTAIGNVVNNIKESISNAWETIKNIVQVGIMFIAELFNFAFTIITLPFRFIWENCKDIIISAWEKIKTAVNTAIDFVKNIITIVFEAIKIYITTVFNFYKNIITTVWNAIVTYIVPVLQKIWDKITTVFNNIKNTITTVFEAVKSFVQTVWNAITTAISNAITSAKNTVSNIINNIKSTVTTVFNNVKSTVTTVWNNILNAIKTPIEKARDAVKNAIDKMKSFFNFTWELPKIKLPHFKISGSFSLNPPSVPSFGVEWYKKAYDNPMILNSPTLFGFANGKFLGGGDGNGGEVIVGQKTLLNLFKSAVREENSETSYVLQNLINMLYDMLFEIIEKIDRPIVLSDGTLISALATGIDETLGEISDGKVRGR